MNTTQLLYSNYITKTYDRLPVAFESGEGIYLYDTNGRKYLDFVCGLAVTNLGHNHPVITKEIISQASKLTHTSNLYFVPNQARLGQLLCQISGMEKVFFCNSGAEANEAAIKLARLYSKRNFSLERNEIITLKNSFHGRTLATLTATGQSSIQEGFEPLLPGFDYAIPNDLDSIVSNINNKTCAIMLELIQGESGVIPMDRHFISNLRDICNEKKLLLIVDEVQTGLGRTGSMFAFDHYSIRPDILTMAKGLANGIPIGAMLTTDEISGVFLEGSHGSTFGGNPFSTAVSFATVNEILNGRYIENAKNAGEYFLSQLSSLIVDFPNLVSGVRGIGLMLGLTIKKPIVKKIILRCLENGLLVAKGGNDTIRFLPPLIVERTHIDDCIEILRGVLSEFESV